SAAESYETKRRIFQPEGRPPQLRDLISDEVLGEFDGLKGVYNDGCFSADGSTVALCRSDKKHELVFVDVASRKVRSRVTTDQPISGSWVLSRDGKILAVSCPDQTVVLIDVSRGMIVRRLGAPIPPPGEDGPRISLTRGAFSPDGQLLAFGTR